MNLQIKIPTPDSEIIRLHNEQSKCPVLSYLNCKIGCNKDRTEWGLNLNEKEIALVVEGILEEHLDDLEEYVITGDMHDLTYPDGMSDKTIETHMKPLIRMYGLYRDYL